MAEQPRQDGEQEPNHASSMEQAEGSRENVQGGNIQGGDAHQQSAGITNRPLEEEQQEQESLPPRGTSKGGSHA
jgi:hypothetical protein